ncbi:MAG TPA: hypothetical protein VF254_07545 [Gammaproteobacteria bacterium]
MRAEEVALLLLAIIFLGLIGTRFVLSRPEPARPVAMNTTGPWHYDYRSRYYRFLPHDIRLFRSEEPQAVAGRVCQAMGGRLHFLRSSFPEKQARVGFNCAFRDSEMTITVDFGDLSRIPARIE